MVKLRTLLLAVALLLALPALVASADAPPGPYFNGFETDTAGWFNLSGATITRVPSGSASTYANGVPAAAGSYYARLGKDPSPDTCTFGGGTAPVGYSTGVDVYLDVPYAMSHPDTRFDWSSAVSDTTGGFRRDFVFNVGTDATGFVISGSNNATRCGAFPANPGNAPIHIVTSGWYTFKHTFTGVPGGPLTVAMQVMPAGTNVPLGTWVRTDASDIIGTTVGGNRYGWFVQNEFDGLAIDNSFRTGATSTPDCTIKITGGGWFTADNGDTATFGGNAKVSSGGTPSGQEQYQDHGPARPIDVKALSVAAIVCGSDGTATIIGSASADGTGSHEFEIELKDAGEPGTSDTYRIRIPDIAYDSGTHTLEGGNIEIH
jgi:hypothetical protein